MSKVADFFHASYGKVKAPFGEFNNGKTPFVSSGDTDNGVVGFFDVPPIYKNVISVARTGSIGSSFYHPYACAINSDCIVLDPKTSLTNEEMLAMVVFLRKNIYRYSYARKVTPRRLLETAIPKDFQSIGKKVDFESVKRQLAPAALEKGINLESREWRWFLLDLLFDIKKGKRLTKENMRPGETPFVGSTELDNGVTAYIDEEPIHQKNTISVTYNGSVAEAFYQPKDFWASDDVNVLYPKNFSLNPYIGLFLCSIIRKEKYRYNYGRKWHLERMRESKIKLPVGNDGHPDWQFMEDYIKSLPYSSAL